MQRKWLVVLTVVSIVMGCEGTHAPTSTEPTAPSPAPSTVGTSERVRQPVASVETCTLPDPPRPREIRTTQRLVYSTEAGRRLRLDVTEPVSEGPHPAVVLLHGGGWRRGNRSYMGSGMRYLAGLGYAAVAVDYRLANAPHDTFPAAVADARCAVRYLRANAVPLDIDPDRIAAMGFSAGGHLAAMLATASDVDGLDGDCPFTDISPRVQAAVAFYAPFDLRPGQQVGPGTRGVIANFLGRRADDDPITAALASPRAHVDSSDPPMLLVQGLRDATVHPDQSRRMYETLSRAGVPATLVEVPDGVHGFGLFPPRAYHLDATCSTLAFLAQTLLDTGGEAPGGGEPPDGAAGP